MNYFKGKRRNSYGMYNLYTWFLGIMVANKKKKSSWDFHYDGKYIGYPFIVDWDTNAELYYSSYFYRSGVGCACNNAI